MEPGCREYDAPVVTERPFPAAGSVARVTGEPPPTPREIEFRSDVTVELVRSSASDSDVLFAARVSTQGEQTLASAAAGPSTSSGTGSEARDRGLLNYLMGAPPGSPVGHKPGA